MQTRIEYADVIISDVLTDHVLFAPERDGTGVDQIGNHVEVTGTGVVHLAAQHLLGVKLGTQHLAVGLNQLLMRLGTARRKFRMLIGESVLFEVYPGAAAKNAPKGTITLDLEKMDIAHGPEMRIEILSIKSGLSATIKFTAKFVIPNCGGGNDKNSTGLVNFRFWIGEDIDTRSWLTSRTYVGTLRVAHKGIHPHALARMVAFPPLQRGFRREMISLQESPDGLHLDFTIRDQEIIAAAPWSPNGKFGAIDWDGVYQVSTSDGVRSVADITVRLTGPKTTSKEDLFFLAQKVVSAKIHLLDFVDPASGFFQQSFLRHFGLKEVLQDNVIEVSARIEHTGSDAYAIGLYTPAKGATIGKPLGGLGINFDDQVAYMPGQTATLTGLFLSALQTPCAPASMPQVIDKPPEDYKPKYGKKSNDKKAADKDLEKYEAVQASESQKKGIYLHCAIDSILHVNSGKLALPTGASSDSRESSIAMISLFRPTAMREIRMEATRCTIPPEVPTPNKEFRDNNGITHTQIGDAQVISGAPVLSADGRKFLHDVHVQINYALSRVPDFNDKLAVGTLPYVTAQSTRQIPNAIFVDPKAMLS